MNPDRWQQVGHFYHAALELAPGERASFLNGACGGDETMRREVESLLRAREQADGFIAGKVAGVVAEMAAQQQRPSLVGHGISHYQIISLLGAGGMGEVYLAEDEQLGRKVAIKLLPAEFTKDPDRVRRFRQEARAASALNHPNIITIHEIGEVQTEAGGLHFIATEFIDGQTLRERMKQRPPKPEESLDVARQVASALAAAHEAGIVHRDIKPENVMVRKDGLVKVLDFGLAKPTAPQVITPSDATVDSTSPTSPRMETESGMVMGTVAYMSPEQARGQKADHRTDIFSLGALLYEMLAGRRPFEGATMNDVIAALLTAEPPPLKQHCAEATAELEQIVGKCLAKDRGARYQSAEELIAELKALRHSSQAEGSAGRRIEAAGARFTARRWSVVAAIAAVLIVGLVWFLSWQRMPAVQPNQIKSLAVLPPRPLQSGARDEALELGTTSILITRLGSLRQLIVRPESAVERYARADQDPLAAGREQKVDAVLDSHYQRYGDKIRFRLRLLRVADGATLWADTLDQPAADPFAIEDALSAKVTGALRLTLSSAEKELQAKRYTNSAEAWQLYVRGRQLVHKRRIPDFEKAIAYFERAIALDQGFALAHVMLGFTYTSLNYHGSAPAKELMPKAKAAYDLALKLDNQLAEAYTYLAQYKHHYEWDFSGAEQSHRRALELNPNSADVHHHYALYLSKMGRFEQAIAEIRRAEELDPTDIFITRNVAQVLYYARRYDEAIEQLQRAVDLNPGYEIAYGWLARAYEMKGDEQRAFAAYLKRAEASGAGAEEIAAMRAAFAAGGLKGCLRRELDRQLGREKSRYVEQFNLALLYARLGEKEQALARLQRAAEDRDLYVTALNVEPVWDSYRTDPRFVALVRRVGLAP